MTCIAVSLQLLSVIS